jgi:acyl carrier protein
VGNEHGGAQASGMIVLRREFPLLGAYVAPRTPTQRKLVEIWCRALSMDQVSVTDHFEELGGDSLLAVSIFADIEEAFAVAVPIAALARSPTIEQLAPRIDELVERQMK